MNSIYLLNDIKYEGIKNLPIFEIEFKKIDSDLATFEALIFTSKNAIHSLNSSKIEWKDIPSYAIAPKTAKLLEKYDSKLTFTGEYSHGNDFAYELIPLLKNKKVLYVRGEKTVSKLSEILLENQINLSEEVAYKTTCSKKDFSKPESNSILIFTSPSSVNCFFKRFSWDKSYKAIAIGRTTAKVIPQDIKVYTSEIQSIESCISLAKTIQTN